MSIVVDIRCEIAEAACYVYGRADLPFQWIYEQERKYVGYIAIRCIIQTDHKGPTLIPLSSTIVRCVTRSAGNWNRWIARCETPCKACTKTNLFSENNSFIFCCD